MHGKSRNFVSVGVVFGIGVIGACGLLASPARAQHHNAHDPRAVAEDPRLAPGQLSPVLEGTGDHHHKVTTESERAQLFFDQGLKLTYGFNHQEALRSFKEAARLDPKCAMAYWGWALVLGPNLNLPMDASLVPQAYEAVQLAVTNLDDETPLERALVEALAKRFTDDPEADRAPLDAAYAEAMREIYEAHPDNTDVATLYAAALMNLRPWDYWTTDGQPRANTPELLAALEHAIELDHEHEGALHYYIHAVEAVNADRGVEAADALRGLAPGAGHLVHMPSHIYMQVGRYGEAFEANALAAKADENYIIQCRAQGIYPVNYYPHNVHFQAWAAFMQGRSAEALRIGRKVASKVPHHHEGNVWGLFQTFLNMPMYTMVRFGMWDEILQEPEPSADLQLSLGVWHYARGLAFTHTDRLDEAEAELAAVQGGANAEGAAEVLIGYSNAEALLTIASEVLAGEIAAKRGDHDRAIGHLSRAVRLQDGMFYNEPPDWYFPVRHTLGAVLLEAGRLGEAEVVYWNDLRDNRENGYSLFGLWKTLEAQGRDSEAVDMEARFLEAWKDADVTLTSSRF